MSQEDEQKLIELAKTDQTAFGVLFDRYYDQIVNYVLHRVADVSVAQDVTAVTFLKAWQGLPSFRWQKIPFSAWLYRIAGHEISNHYRRAKRQTLSLDALYESSGFEPPSEQDLEADLIHYQEELHRHRNFVLVQSVLLSLPEKYQTVLVLRYFEKKSIVQIAEITSQKPGTVKSQLSRGSQKLRTAFLNRKRENQTVQPF